jgi:hypothetical protein
MIELKKKIVVEKVMKIGGGFKIGTKRHPTF